MFESDELYRAWSLLNEYHEFHRLAAFRVQLEKQLTETNISFTRVPWREMVHALLTQNQFSDKQLKEMHNGGQECCTEADIALSRTTIDLVLSDHREDEKYLTDTWFEIDDLKQRFRQAAHVVPSNRLARKQMCRQILGYPTDYVDNEIELEGNQLDDVPLDLTRVLTVEEQKQLHTGDLVSPGDGNRLHDVFYVYRTPQKGIWAQVQQMWQNHHVTEFKFDTGENEHMLQYAGSKEEELILVPAMDEYGYGVPFLFGTRPMKDLPDGAMHRYVDINCPQIARDMENPVVALVQQHVAERLKKPVYEDRYMGGEMSVIVDRFPQEYVATVPLHDGPLDNVLWVRRLHYDGQQTASNLNDNKDIFFSRRLLEAEEQFQQLHASN